MFYGSLMVFTKKTPTDYTKRKWEANQSMLLQENQWSTKDSSKRKKKGQTDTKTYRKQWTKQQ